MMIFAFLEQLDVEIYLLKVGTKKSIDITNSTKKSDYSNKNYYKLLNVKLSFNRLTLNSLKITMHD